jgi:hypothetical protein
MPSPFPGADPYLEVHPIWQRFHAWFVRELARIALPDAQEIGCWIDVEHSVYQREPTGEMTLLGEPDEVLGVESGRWPSTGTSGSTAALAEPQAVHEVRLDLDVQERLKQAYLVIRELDELRRVLAVVEILSPANKSGDYSLRYQEKRRRLIASPAHFLEIDLLRAGKNPSRDLFPELPAAPYFIFLARKTTTGRREEANTLRLQDPLPIVGLPVTPSRPELPLDLPAAFSAAYDLSVPPSVIHYDRPPPGKLSEEDAAWVAERLRERGLRE